MENRMRSRSRSPEFDRLPPAPLYSRSPDRNYSPPRNFQRSPGRFSEGDRSPPPVQPNYTQNRARFSCEECEIKCPTYTHLQNHMTSRRHLLRVETLEREMREAARDSREHFERRSQRDDRGHKDFRGGHSSSYWD